MPSMNWETFQASHFRPHLVVSHLPVNAEPEEGKTTLERVIASLNLSGNYAFQQDRESIRVAFEKDADAGRLASMLRAKATRPESEWGSSAVAHLSRTVQRRMAAALEQLRSRRGREPA